MLGDPNAGIVAVLSRCGCVEDEWEGAGQWILI